MLCFHRLTCISGAPAVPGSLVSRQLSCLLASGVQDRSKEAGWRLMMPARAWFESGLHLLTSMWLQRRLSQLLQRTSGSGETTHGRSNQRHRFINQEGDSSSIDVPFVPGLADGHAGQQLGSVQVFEHRHPDLLLSAFFVAHVLKGGQRQQGGGRQGEGCGGSCRFLVLRGGCRAILAASVPVDAAQTWPVRRRGGSNIVGMKV